MKKVFRGTEEKVVVSEAGSGTASQEHLTLTLKHPSGIAALRLLVGQLPHSELGLDK